jgi:hypothetical protein
MNRFAYVGGNPVSSIDPFGLMGNCGVAGGPCKPPKKPPPDTGFGPSKKIVLITLQEVDFVHYVRILVTRLKSIVHENA